MIIFVFSSGCSSVVSTQQTVTSEAYVERKNDNKGVLLTPSLHPEESKTSVPTEYSPVYVFSIAVAGLMALALSSMLITRRERLGPR